MFPKVLLHEHSARPAPPSHPPPPTAPFPGSRETLFNWAPKRRTRSGGGRTCLGTDGPVTQMGPRLGCLHPEFSEHSDPWTHPHPLSALFLPHSPTPSQTPPPGRTVADHGESDTTETTSGGSFSRHTFSDLVSGFDVSHCHYSSPYVSRRRCSFPSTSNYSVGSSSCSFLATSPLVP